MKIDAFLTPYFPEVESQFDNNIVIMIDVFRASTSVCASLFNGAKEVLTYDSLDKAVKIYSNLDKKTRFLGGERNGQKPSGFDAGNSPCEYSEEAVAKRSVIISTTNGTKIFQMAKSAEIKVVGGFVNINSIFDYIKDNYLQDDQAKKDAKISIMCAGSNGRISYEDTLCAGAFINKFKSIDPEVKLTDTADAAKNLYNLHSVDLNAFLKTREHSIYLHDLGFEADIDLCLNKNLYPVVPIISGNSIKTPIE